MEKLTIFFLFSKNVFITLLKAAKTIKKKFRVVSGKFEKILKKISLKKEYFIVANFFEKKNTPIFFKNNSKDVLKHNLKGKKKLGIVRK